MADIRVFELRFRVPAEDIDGMGHVNNVAYLRYAQDAATAHWKSRATPEQIRQYAWVARRHEIDYLRPALPDDELLARTWVGATSGATYDRHVELLRAGTGEVLARVRTVWVLLDARTLRPRRVPPELREQFEIDLPAE